MKIRYVIIFFLILLNPILFANGQTKPTGFDYSNSLGTGVRLSETEVCARFTHSELVVDTPIVVISLYQPQTISEGKIVGIEPTACTRTNSQLGHTYLVKVTTGKIESAFGLITIVGSKTAFTKAKGLITADLDQDGEPERFGLCWENEELFMCVSTGKKCHWKKPVFGDGPVPTILKKPKRKNA